MYLMSYNIEKDTYEGFTVQLVGGSFVSVPSTEMEKAIQAGFPISLLRDSNLWNENGYGVPVRQISTKSP